MSDHNKKIISYLSNTTLLIGGITLLGYYLAYHYQKGFIGFYKLDKLFVSNISITNIMEAIVVIFSFLVILLPAIAMIKRMIFPKKFINEYNMIHSFIMKNAFAIPLLIAYVSSVFFNLKYLTSLIFMGIYLSLFFFPNLIIAVFDEDNKLSYKDKLRNSIKKNDVFSFENILTSATSNILNIILVIIGSIVLLSTLADFMGFNSASNKKEYQMIEYEGNNYVVIALHSENLVVAPYDIEKNQILASYKIINGTSLLQHSISMKYINLDESPNIIVNE